MKAGFKNALEGNGHVVDIRGLGLMIGIELDKPCTELVAKAMAKGLLINVTANSTIRLLPPLIMTNEQADTVIATVVDLITEFYA